MNISTHDGGAPDFSHQASKDGPGLEGVTINANDRRWRDLLELDARMERDRGIRMLTPEARVMIYLMLSGPVPVSTVMQAAGTSYRGFYAVLERLKQAGLIESERDQQDQRVRRLTLDPSLTAAPGDR